MSRDATASRGSTAAERAGKLSNAARRARLLTVTLDVFLGLETAPALLLAVSGGPDSMALLLLAARWAAADNRQAALHVATVDHGLRAESANEAALVATAAARLGLPHETLAWAGDKPTIRIQERARAARYALLAAHALAIGATHVLTAHHADDQAETVLMRLSRGSGIGGLAGMRREVPLAPGVALVRPLLAVPKAELVAICEVEGLAFVDDPSNRDPAYARARLRAESARLAALGLDRTALLRLAARAARADAALDAEAARVEAVLITDTSRQGASRNAVIASSRRSNPAAAGDALKTSSPVSPGLLRFARLDEDHRDIQPEILLRLLRRTIERTVPGVAPPRLERLERLAEGVATALRERRPHRATLGGAQVVLDTDAVLQITPAPPRRHGAGRG